MQVKFVPFVIAWALACGSAFADPQGRPDHGGGGNGGSWNGGWDRDRNRRPSVIIEPNITIERNRPVNVDTPDFVMAELDRCVTAGIRLFVDCLRQNHGSIMIRRLEACVQSETIPDDPARIEPCLPLPAVR